MKACLLSQESILPQQGGEKEEKRVKWVGCDYSREVTILYFSIRGRRLFEGWLLFEEIPYVVLQKNWLENDLTLLFF